MQRTLITMQFRASQRTLNKIAVINRTLLLDDKVKINMAQLEQEP
jgi:hypothetical protein